ncbi:MAG: hypothetical protein AVDCRST_MAG29-1434, partial [uncultured Nocardioidaceae bacterium]
DRDDDPSSRPRVLGPPGHVEGGCARRRLPRLLRGRGTAPQGRLRRPDRRGQLHQQRNQHLLRAGAPDHGRFPGPSGLHLADRLAPRCLRAAAHPRSRLDVAGPGAHPRDGRGAPGGDRLEQVDRRSDRDAGAAGPVHRPRRRTRDPRSGSQGAPRRRPLGARRHGRLLVAVRAHAHDQRARRRPAADRAGDGRVRRLLRHLHVPDDAGRRDHLGSDRAARHDRPDDVSRHGRGRRGGGHPKRHRLGRRHGWRDHRLLRLRRRRGLPGPRQGRRPDGADRLVV